jgi:hypothetical protein
MDMRFSCGRAFELEPAPSAALSFLLESLQKVFKSLRQAFKKFGKL